MRREIKRAEGRKTPQGRGLPRHPTAPAGRDPKALENWFGEEPVAVPVQLGPGGLDEALPAILAALGERLPTDHEAMAKPEAGPIEELVLSLADPKIETELGKRRLAAMATLTSPADAAAGRS